MDERRKNFAKKWYGKYNFIQRQKDKKPQTRPVGRPRKV